ncbi:hypothetical protein N5D61_04720 [Pseudomonas sp. GD03842]|uniref:hypothetical protein n=1 Tax=unclassified Pseudomonas TaxID=196821 RepID=UPI000D3AC91B|nr:MULTISPECIES: hypothetical protein [unclassified Pseudomonas]MDH0745644.1 hypothetical protein [Pseudomonas sp. GD03842]RAU45539.1 hypothetical protein DBP26_014050 [Pseudomonas sp. RIT 409]RAU53078.1 hypothetical protein DBY65_015695 [Pseudomonas sp. RIT 412]
MISKMTKALILSGCLVAAGAASAADRDVVVPVIAGAAVGAVLATVISGSGHDHHRPDYRDYRPRPRYQPVYQPVAYVPVAPRRFAPPPPPPPHAWHPRGHDYHVDYRRDNRW